jgi:nucleoside diphosphate kinase
MRAVNKFENEAGVSLSGLLAVLVVIGAVALVAIKVTPALIEYRAVKGAIVKAKSNGGTVREMQQSFDHNAEVNSISSIHGRDLVISRENGEPEISFAYEKRVPLFGNVSLLFDFEGTTDPGGTVAAKADTAAR